MADLADKMQISLRIPVATVDSFEKLARILERDRTWVMLRALKLYLTGEGADILRDADSLAALDRGEVFDVDAVLDEADKKVAEAKARSFAARG